MSLLNRQETEDLIIDLYYNQKKTFREIQRIVRKSPRDIKVILNKAEPGRSSLSIPAQAYRLFSEGKTPIDVAIILNIREPEATQFNLEYWKLSQLGNLNRIYQEAGGNISPLAELHRHMKAAGMTVEHVIKLLQLANNDLRSIERICQELKRKEADLTAKNLNAARTFQQLSNDISEESKKLDQYRSTLSKERLELAKLQIQKEKLESVVRQFQNNNEGFCKIKQLVDQAVAQSLTNSRDILELAFLSVIDSCRRDPTKFSVLYHNLSSAALTTRTRVTEFDMMDQYTYGLSTKDQLCHQHEKANDEVAYSKVLVDLAEQFFNKMIKELEQVCINRLIEAFISGSVSSRLTKKSFLDSKAVLPIQAYGNKKEDPLR